MSSCRLPLFVALFSVATVACSLSGGASAFTSDRIVVTTRGSGADVVLVPGLTSHPSVWDDVIARLGDGLRVHIVHVRGFAGLEPGANAEGDVVAPVADEVARYVRAAQLQAPVIAGHSMGGTIAMTIAARHPGIAGSVLSVDAPPFIGVAFGGDSPDAVRPVADQMRDAIINTPAGTPGDVLEQMVAGMTVQENQRASLVDQARASHRPTVARAFHELIVTDLRPELARVTTPMTVLFVIPEGVPLPPDVFEASFRAMFSGVPHARLQRVDNSGHAIHVDQPQDVADTIRELLDAQEARRGGD
jgi:pimeloyl-ACP methyl ester carboxylesterase